MELLLFRHGIAEPAGPDQSDDDRALTRQGVERTMAAARGLALIADRPQAILTSPKRRAVQTAAIAGEVFELQPEPVGVLAEGPAAPIVHMLTQRGEMSIMLVGHEPWMSELVERLCVPREPSAFIVLKKAGCAFLEAPIEQGQTHGTGRLHWLIPPRVLRALTGK